MKTLPSEPRERIILAADVSTMLDFGLLLEQVGHSVGLVKVGLELLTAVGAPLVVETANSAGFKVMFDGKFHDIPNTMAKATRAVAGLGVSFFTVHASATVAGMQAAAKEKGQSKMLAVTALTSLDKETCEHVYGTSIEGTVLRFAQYAYASVADGLVCSPKEIVMLRREREFDDLILVTPGVRPAWAAKGDQSRVMTPRQAVEAGADYLVVGRPITKPPPEIGSPAKAVELIAEEIAEGLAARGGVR